jgi:hypothetical protein
MQLIADGTQGPTTIPAKRSPIGVPGFAQPYLPGSVEPTVWGPDIANTVIAEFLAVLTAAGLTPDPTNNAQLLASLNVLYGRLASPNRWTGVNTFTQQPAVPLATQPAAPPRLDQFGIIGGSLQSNTGGSIYAQQTFHAPCNGIIMVNGNAATSEGVINAMSVTYAGAVGSPFAGANFLNIPSGGGGIAVITSSARVTGGAEDVVIQALADITGGIGSNIIFDFVFIPSP